MPKSSTFALPEGVQLDVTGDAVDLRYDGNVEISGTLPRKFGNIVAGGDLTIRIPGAITGNLRAGGVLTIAGDVDCGNVHAREIVLGKQNVKVRALSADYRITIGPATVVADVIIAPDIQMDPKAQGRVTVIESANERGATKIKGGFGLSDYEDMFGNANEFLDQRGVKRLDPAAVAAARAAATSAPPASTPAPAAATQPTAPAATPQPPAAPATQPAAPPPTQVSTATPLAPVSPPVAPVPRPAAAPPPRPLQPMINPFPAPPGDEVTIKMPLRTTGAPVTGSSEIPPQQLRQPGQKRSVLQRSSPKAPPPPPPEPDEDVDDPLSISFDDLEPLMENNAEAPRPAPAPAPKDDLHQRLSEAVDRITAAYAGTDLPPAIEELKELVRSRDYDALRQNVTEIWNGLLGFHQRRGIRPHHQVTHAFNVIHGLLQP